MCGLQSEQTSMLSSAPSLLHTVIFPHGPHSVGTTSPAAAWLAGPWSQSTYKLIFPPFPARSFTTALLHKYWMKRGGNTWLQGGKRSLLTAAGTSVSSEKWGNQSIRTCSCSLDYKADIAKLALEWCKYERRELRPGWLPRMHPCSWAVFLHRQGEHIDILLQIFPTLQMAMLLFQCFWFKPALTRSQAASTLTFMGPDQICSIWK